MARSWLATCSSPTITIPPQKTLSYFPLEWKSQLLLCKVKLPVWLIGDGIFLFQGHFNYGHDIQEVHKEDQQTTKDSLRKRASISTTLTISDQQLDHVEDRNLLEMALKHRYFRMFVDIFLGLIGEWLISSDCGNMWEGNWFSIDSDLTAELVEGIRTLKIGKHTQITESEISFKSFISSFLCPPTRKSFYFHCTIRIKPIWLMDLTSWDHLNVIAPWRAADRTHSGRVKGILMEYI